MGSVMTTTTPAVEELLRGLAERGHRITPQPRAIPHPLAPAGRPLWFQRRHRPPRLARPLPRLRPPELIHRCPTAVTSRGRPRLLQCDAMQDAAASTGAAPLDDRPLDDLEEAPMLRGDDFAL